MASPAEHQELIEKAFVALLLDPTQAFDWPASLKNGAADAPAIYTGQADTTKKGQNVSCAAPAEMGEEDPLSSGNFWCELRVELRTPKEEATPDAAAAGAQTSLQAHQAAAATLRSAIMVADLEGDVAAANDALAGGPLDFTLIGVRRRTPFKDESDPECWVSGFVVECLSCPRLLS